MTGSVISSVILLNSFTSLTFGFSSTFEFSSSFLFSSTFASAFVLLEDRRITRVRYQGLAFYFLS